MEKLKIKVEVGNLVASNIICSITLLIWMNYLKSNILIYLYDFFFPSGIRDFKSVLIRFEDVTTPIVSM